ncbi:MAG: DUF4040 domain-containing protein [Thermotogae bacterium]|nr:DUF4040 domain-containing protein [Thermotogota bacterium]
MLFQFLLILLMLIGAIAVYVFKSLINAVVAMALVSLIASILFYFLQAPDVAMAEASVGAALTTAIFVIAIRKTRKREDKE